MVKHPILRLLPGGILVTLGAGGMLAAWVSQPGAGNHAARLLLVALGAAAFLIALGGLVLPAAPRIALLVTVLWCITGLVVAELSLGWLPASRFDDQARVRAAARQLGRTVDPRPQAAVIRDLRAGGVEAYPIVFPRDLMRHPPFAAAAAGQGGLLPLTGLPRRTIVGGNECGETLVFVSDRYGFRNPDRVWEQDSLDLVLVGDSFTEGLGVGADEGFAEVLRHRWPLTLNLGVGGNGPLLELATLREFLGPRKARVLLWVYYEGNDLGDLDRERRSPLLRAYLAPGASQGLAVREPEIEAALRPWLDSLYDRALRRVPAAPVPAWKSALKLTRLRTALGFTRERGPDDDPEARGAVTAGRVDLFPDILRAAHALAASSDADLYVVYLPAWDRYFSTAAELDRGRRAVLEVVRDAHLPLIDLLPVFDSAPRKAQLFTQGSMARSHYSPGGYAEVARVIAHALAPRLAVGRARGRSGSDEGP